MRSKCGSVNTSFLRFIISTKTQSVKWRDEKIGRKECMITSQSIKSAVKKLPLDLALFHKRSSLLYVTRMVIRQLVLLFFNSLIRVTKLIE